MGKTNIITINDSPARTSRRPAKKLSRHSQQRSQTLMRRAVKKPGASLKRRIRVQGHTDALIDQPLSRVMPKTSFGSPDPKRLQRASNVKKSQLIRHFNLGEPGFAISVTVTKPVVEPISLPVSAEPTAPTPDFLEQAIERATSHLEPAPKKPRKHLLHLKRKHA